MKFKETIFSGWEFPVGGLVFVSYIAIMIHLSFDIFFSWAFFMVSLISMLILFEPKYGLLANKKRVTVSGESDEQ